MTPIEGRNHLPLKRAFEKYGWHWQESELLLKNIRVKQKGDFWTVKPENVVLASKIKTEQDLKVHIAMAEL